MKKKVPVVQVTTPESAGELRRYGLQQRRDRAIISTSRFARVATTGRPMPLIRTKPLIPICLARPHG